MKKKNLKSLELNKKSISSFNTENIKGKGPSTLPWVCDALTISCDPSNRNSCENNGCMEK